jgi:hypothetical protein
LIVSWWRRRELLRLLRLRPLTRAFKKALFAFPPTCIIKFRGRSSMVEHKNFSFRFFLARWRREELLRSDKSAILVRIQTSPLKDFIGGGGVVKSYSVMWKTLFTLFPLLKNYAGVVKLASRRFRSLFAFSLERVTSLSFSGSVEKNYFVRNRYSRFKSWPPH